MRNRKSNRLQNYDYSQNGMYFVTICTQNRECYFGEIIGGKMVLNEYGIIMEKQLNWLENQYSYINLDCFTIMPNHLHLILEILSPVGTGRDLSLRRDPLLLPIKIKPLSELIGALKTTSSKLIHQNGFNSFSWQRSFYDRIIRNDAELNRIREYILSNPKMWERDRNNTENIFI